LLSALAKQVANKLKTLPLGCGNATKVAPRMETATATATCHFLYDFFQYLYILFVARDAALRYFIVGQPKV